MKRRDELEEAEREARQAEWAVFSISNIDRYSWAEVEVIEHVERQSHVLVKIIDGRAINAKQGDTARLVTDRGLFKYQYPFDRHVMTTIGARFVIQAIHDNRIGIYRWGLKRLTYGLETWDRGFHW